MRFLIETVRPATPADRGRHLALLPTLGEVRDLAAELFAGDVPALAALDALGGSPEGELSGAWGEFRFAPAC